MFFSHSSNHQRYPRSTSAPQVMHNPSPSLRTIDTSGRPPAPQFQHIRNPQSTVQNSNLRAVPIVQNPSCKVKVSNLPASVDFGRISQMTTACGGVKTIQVRKRNFHNYLTELMSHDKTNPSFKDLTWLTRCYGFKGFELWVSTGCPKWAETGFCWLGFRVCHCLPDSAWAHGNFAGAAGQDGGTFQIKVNPTQVSAHLGHPAFGRNWGLAKTKITLTLINIRCNLQFCNAKKIHISGRR